MDERDVERILREIVTSRDLRVAIVRVQPVMSGWHVTVRDPADRLVSTHLPDAPPAAIRTALAMWLDPPA